MRTGMRYLVRRLREMTEAGLQDYELAGVTYWTDDTLEDILDEKRTRQEDVALTARPEYISSVDIYKRYEIPWSMGHALEGTEGGTTVFRVYNSIGTTVTGWTFNDRDMSIEFSSDQEGTAYYWSGYQYDIRAAAVEVWLRKAAHSYNAINFSADGHRFDRKAIYEHCIEQAKLYGYQRKVQATKMVRTDLAGAEKDLF
jgi:hypothetical protein